MFARLADGRGLPRLRALIAPSANSQGMIAAARRFVLGFLPLLMPLLAYGLTAAGEEVTRSLFGSGDVIAFGKRVFILIAARVFVRDVLTDPILRLLGRYVLLPIAALYAVSAAGHRDQGPLAARKCRRAG